MSFYNNSTPDNGQLSPPDREHLAACGITDEVMDARGYWTARSAPEVPRAFREDWERRQVGLVIPSLSPSGEVRYQLRVRKRWRGKNGKLSPKYLKPTGSENGLDVSPLMLEEVRCGTSLLIHTEGCKGVDACASWGVAAIGDGGVHCFAKPKTKGTVPIDDFAYVNMERPHLIVYDADAKANETVQVGLGRRDALTRKLAGPGQQVKVAYLPRIEGIEEPGKAGIDDFFAAGYDLTDLLNLAEDYEPVDVGTERVKRDPGLAEAVEDMYEGWTSYDWPAMIGIKTRRNIFSGHSARDACEAAIGRSKSTGKVFDHPEHGEIVVFPWSNTRWAEAAAMSRPTLIKAKKNLIAEGLLVEVEKPNDHKNPYTYALLIGKAKPLTTNGEGAASAKRSEVEDGSSTCGKRFDALPARLRWSSGGWKPKRGVIPGTSRVRTTPERPPIPPTTRPGKVAGAINDHLVLLGGGTTYEHLLEAAHLSPKQAAKPLAMLEEFGIVACGEYEGQRIVMHAHDWRDALGAMRRLTGEHLVSARERERMRVRARAWAQKKTDWSYIQRQRHRRQNEPWKPQTKGERVEQLIRAGMGRRAAAEEVYGDDPPHGPKCHCPECY